MQDVIIMMRTAPRRGRSRVACAGPSGYSTPMSRMGKRIIFGAIMIAVLAAVLWGDWRLEQWVVYRDRDTIWLSGIMDITAPYRGLPVAILTGIVSALGFLELRRMAAGSGAKMLVVSGLPATVILATASYWTVALGAWMNPAAPLHPLAVLPLVTALVFADQMARRRTAGALPELATTLLAVAYIGGCGAAVLGLRMLFGLRAMILFLVAAKFTDIGAYFTGSFLGKHKLIPWLSPGKSWEGLIGGLLVGAGACAMFVVITDWCQWHEWRSLTLSAWQGAVFGAVVGLAGQFADLCESLLKRSAGLKDSGAVVPEFGGVLDIIDSVLLSAPVAAILLAVLR